jgi:peptidyl-prolyl cis-trans isomerase D
MLQAIRDRATGWIAWAIIILICIPFALWGIQEFATTDRGLVVARVNDTEIGYYQYRSAYQQQRERLQQMLGGAPIPRELLEGGRLQQQALERLITDEVLVQSAVNGGLRVGDGQLAGAIRTLPALQSGGAFSQQVYDGFLRARGTTAQGFELDMRRAMLSEQVISALSRTAIVTSRDVDAAMRLRNEQRRFQLLRVEPGEEQVEDPSPDQIREWFEANPERYVRAERVKVRYIELSRDAIASGVTADETELQAIYEVQRANYRTPEQREARHILLDVPREATAEQDAEVRARIQALRDRLEAGADFAELAKEASEDPGSAPLGGGLGFFGRGVMDPAFEQAAFSLEPGAVSEPVRSRFGWHLIQVTQVQEERVRSFEEAREDVLAQYRSRQAEQIFAEDAERLATLGFENPTSLEVAAQELGTSPEESDFFARDGEGAAGVLAQGAVREAAFSDDVLNAGNNSELLQVAPGRVLMLRVLERQASRAQTLDEVREEIATLLRGDAAMQQATATGERVLQALRSGTPIADAAAAEGLAWSAEQTVTRAEPGALPAATLRALYAIPAPAGEQPGFAGTSLPSGEYVVIALHEVAQAALEPKQADEVRNRVARSLEAGYGQQAVSAVIGTLRKQADVEILEQNLRPEDG